MCDAVLHRNKCQMRPEDIRASIPMFMTVPVRKGLPFDSSEIERP
jgi:hypothetical protein